MSILRRTAKAAGPVTFVPDVSEFQPDLHDPVLLKWTKAVIIRAMYGSAHDDKAWFGGQRRALLHQGGAAFVGVYQYLVADQSAVVQAKAFLELVGPLRPGEKYICDLEEGAGNQAGRWQAWAKTVKAATGETPWLYSGLDFARTHGLSPEWVAAYPTSRLLKPPAVPKGEPAGTHVLWQFSPNFEVPGVGACDCSVFHGSAEELAALAHQPAARRPAPPARLAAPPARPAAVLAGLPVLKPGDRDTHEPWMVRRVQGLIGALGPDCKVTGTFDAATEAALKGFQQNHGIPQTGTTDPATWAMLLYGRAV